MMQQKEEENAGAGEDQIKLDQSAASCRIKDT